MPLLAVMILLSGCAGTVYKTDLEIYCPPIEKYSDDYNEKLSEELLALPTEGTAIETALIDYMSLRDKIRACYKERDKRDG